MPEFTPAIFHHPDAIEGKGRPLVGRRSSGQSFLKGFLRHIEGDKLAVAVQKKEHAEEFLKIARSLGDNRPVKYYSPQGRQNYSEPGSMFFPGPGFMDFNWVRMRQDPKCCSLIGITHTVSTMRVMKGLHSLISEPVEDWDAIICTSRAVKSVVATQFDIEKEFFKQRFGAKHVPLPYLPVIPLGINTDDFKANDAKRSEIRAKYGLGEKDVVVLCVGRQSSVEKAHPVPMYKALAQAAKEVNSKIHIWMVGWSSQGAEAKLHRATAKEAGPDVNVKFIDGRDEWVRSHVWSGADIFSLPSDSIQETFGLVPVEAMAAQLPVVMPNWDGFRDTIIDGETGILVKTRMLSAGEGTSHAARYFDGSDAYLHHLAAVQQKVQIDLVEYKNAFVKLINDPNLRKKMGQAGSKHAAANLDWSAIIPKYQELSDEMSKRRNFDRKPISMPVHKAAIHPLEIDPFHLYAGYPSHVLRNTARVEQAQKLDEDDIATLRANASVSIYRRIVGRKEDLLKVHAQASQGETVESITKATGLSLVATRSIVLFLAKFGYLTIHDT